MLRAFLLAVLMAAPYLKLSPNARYHVDANNSNAPFLIHGECAGLGGGWKISAQGNTDAPSSADEDTYLDDRQAKGFNSVFMFPIYHDSATGLMGANPNGDRPFTSNDFSRPVSAYWTYFDALITKLANRGMVAFFFPAWAGFAGGPEEMYANLMVGQIANMRTYGRFLGNRYNGVDNIVWMWNGDQQVSNRNVYRQIAYGVVDKDITRPKLHSAQCQRGDDNADEFLGQAWYQTNAVYTLSDQNLYQGLRTGYGKNHRMPAWLLEGWFEGEHSMTAQQVRRNAYWALTSGGCGQFFGNNPIWLFASGWQAALASAGSVQMGHVWNLFSARAWHQLVPDTAHVVATSGIGTDGNTDQATFARTPDGSLVIGYVPTATSPVIDMTKMRGTTNVRRYNPTSGAFTTLNGSAANTGTLTLTHPGSNGNASDWLWVLEA